MLPAGHLPSLQMLTPEGLALLQSRGTSAPPLACSMMNSFWWHREGVCVCVCQWTQACYPTVSVTPMDKCVCVYCLLAGGGSVLPRAPLVRGGSRWAFKRGRDVQGADMCKGRMHEMTEELCMRVSMPARPVCRCGCTYKCAHVCRRDCKLVSGCVPSVQTYVFACLHVLFPHVCVSAGYVSLQDSTGLCT